MSTSASPGARVRGSRASVRWLLALGLAAFVGVVVARSYLRPSGAGHPAVGRSLRVSGLVPVAGHAQPVVAEDLRDKQVVVHFWATWCGPCRMELPQIARLSRELAGREDCALLAIAVDEGSAEDVRAEVLSLLRSLDLDLPVYADPSGATFRSFLDSGGQRGVPTTVLLDRDGRMSAVWVGFNPHIEGDLTAAMEAVDTRGSVGRP